MTPSRILRTLDFRRHDDHAYTLNREERDAVVPVSREAGPEPVPPPPRSPTVREAAGDRRRGVKRLERSAREHPLRTAAVAGLTRDSVPGLG